MWISVRGKKSVKTSATDCEAEILPKADYFDTMHPVGKAIVSSIQPKWVSFYCVSDNYNQCKLGD